MDEQLRRKAFNEEMDVLLKKYQVKDDELASFCVGVFVSLCKNTGEDPVEFVRWAMQGDN